MTAPVSGFEFTDDIPAAGDGRLIVRIPAGLNRKRRVLAEYARQLRFPRYFGWNWDAFEECLRDRSWLGNAKEIVIVHRDVPFVDSPEQLPIYLSILHELVRQENGGMKVQVIFPRRDTQTVSCALEN